MYTRVPTEYCRIKIKMLRCTPINISTDYSKRLINMRFKIVELNDHAII